MYPSSLLMKPIYIRDNPLSTSFSGRFPEIPFHLAQNAEGVVDKSGIVAI